MATLAPWEAESKALCQLIEVETNEAMRRELRRQLLRVRYTPWRVGWAKGGRP